MNNYRVTRYTFVRDEAVVAAEDREQALTRAYEQGFTPVTRDVRDIRVEPE